MTQWKTLILTFKENVINVKFSNQNLKKIERKSLLFRENKLYVFCIVYDDRTKGYRTEVADRKSDCPVLGWIFSSKQKFAHNRLEKSSTNI